MPQPTLPPSAATITTAEDIVLRIMGAHWDMATCRCWVCRKGYELGLGIYERYANSCGDNRERLPVPQIGWTPKEEVA